MTSVDLFLIIATIALIFVAAFMCCALYWFMRVMRVWYMISSDIEEHMRTCIQKAADAFHALTGLKAFIDVGVQTLHTALALYQKRATKKKQKKTDGE